MGARSHKGNDMGKFAALWRVLKQGEELADADKWRRHQFNASAIVAFLSAVVALLRAFGVEVPLGDAEVDAAGVFLLALINWGVTAAVHRGVGLPSGPAPVAPAGGDSLGPVDSGGA